MSWVLLGAGMKNSLRRFRRNEADSHGRGPVTDCLMHADKMLMGKLHVEKQWWRALLKTAHTLPTHSPTPIDSDSTQLGTLPDVSTLLKSRTENPLCFNCSLRKMLNHVMKHLHRPNSLDQTDKSFCFIFVK